MENASLTGTAPAFNSELKFPSDCSQALGPGLESEGTRGCPVARQGGKEDSGALARCGCSGGVRGVFGGSAPPGSVRLGAAPALKSWFGSRAIFEARNVSVTIASALSHTFHVIQDCAQS